MTPILNCSQSHLRMLTRNEVFRLIAKGELNQAMENMLLNILCKEGTELSPDELKVILLFSQLGLADSCFFEGLIEYRDYSIHKMRITHALVNLLNKQIGLLN